MKSEKEMVKKPQINSRGESGGWCGFLLLKTSTTTTADSTKEIAEVGTTDAMKTAVEIFLLHGVPVTESVYKNEQMSASSD